MGEEVEKLVERLRDIYQSDHERGCQGRCYSCSCGFDTETWKTAEEAADLLELVDAQRDDARDALEVTETQLHDAVVALRAAEAQVEALRKAAIRVRARCQRMRLDPDASAALDDLGAALAGSTPESVKGGASRDRAPTLRAALERVSAWIMDLPIPTTGATAQLMNIADALAGVTAKSAVELGDGKCFECGTDLHAPFCPACNPEMVSAQRLRATLEEIDGCFNAALVEGWWDALENGDIERIRDIWDRRLGVAQAIASVPIEAEESGDQATIRQLARDLDGACDVLRRIANHGDGVQGIEGARAAAKNFLGTTSLPPPPENAVGAAEREVGRYVYRRIEALMGCEPGTSDAVELDYLATIASSVEEYGEEACAGHDLWTPKRFFVPLLPSEARDQRNRTAQAEEGSAAPTEAVADIEAWALDLQGQLNTAEAAVFLREADISDLRKTLEGVRDDLHNENRLNTHSIVDVIWHSEIETTVDFIDAALARTAEARSALPDREELGRLIYLAMYGPEGAVWAANESKEVWYAAADRLRSSLPTPPKA